MDFGHRLLQIDATCVKGDSLSGNSQRRLLVPVAELDNRGGLCTSLGHREKSTETALADLLLRPDVDLDAGIGEFALDLGSKKGGSQMSGWSIGEGANPIRVVTRDLTTHRRLLHSGITCVVSRNDRGDGGGQGFMCGAHRAFRAGTLEAAEDGSFNRGPHRLVSVVTGLSKSDGQALAPTDCACGT